MKSILMMVMAGCPHCARALRWMNELKTEHPEFAHVPVKIVDEMEEPDFAAKLDYYYVPTYFVDGAKLHEGVPTRKAIEAVYRAALD